MSASTPDLAALLHAEAARWRARGRAWVACGVPLGVNVEEHPFAGKRGLRLALRCSLCDDDCYGTGDVVLPHASQRMGRYSVAKWHDEELDAVWGRALSDLRRDPCPHLAPLLGEDPPEVRAIYELELLAGG